MTSSDGDGLAGTVVRRRAALALAWLAAAAVLLPLARRAEDRFEVQARILGSESAEVERLLATRFESPFAHGAVLVLAGVPGPGSPEGRAVLGTVVEALRARPEVSGTFSYLDQPEPHFAGERGQGMFVLVGLEAPNGRVDRLLQGLRAATAALAARLRHDHPEISLRWTGEAAINFDLWRTSTDESRTAERRALPVTLVLLVAAFGSVVAALLPVASGALAVALTLGLLALASAVASLSVLVVSVASMLGLALGIDYALLTLSRFREARAAGSPPAPAAAEAARRAGGTAVLSGAVVAVGFLALLLVPLTELRSAVLGGLVVVVVSVLLAATLLPGALAALGPHLEAGRILPRRAADGQRWRAWARRVTARPWLVLLLAGTPILLLAVPAARLNPQVPRGPWLPPQMESTKALDDLRAMGRSGVVESLRVVLELPATTTVLEREGWEAQRRLAERLAADPRVARVQSLRTLAGERADDLTYVSLLPAVAKRSFLASEGDAALLEVVPKEDVDPEDLASFVRELRRKDAALLTGMPGTRLNVGGLPAFNADYEDAVGGRMPWVVGIIVAVTLLSLYVAFRSVLVALKAVALNLLAVSCAFGALVLVFQDGHGVRLLGLEGPVDGVFPIVPALVFCTVFGLSMDYEVFLVSRVAEARRAGMSDEEAIGEGLARTGGVITSAAAIMIAVFGAFVLGSFVLIKMLGFALAVAVLVDATVIRVAIGPALLRLAGRWNWWPGG
jgi:RND superfamily putative drug exporter